MDNKEELNNLFQQAYELLYNSDEEEEEEAEEAPKFDKTEYWDERYSKDLEPYEWFISYSDVSQYVDDFFQDKTFDKSLNLGCGNSTMFIDIEKFFNDVYNIDISGVVIEQMTKKYEENKKQHFQQMDCTQLNYPPVFFDVVFDKATLDAISCTADREKVNKSIIQLFNVLKIGGYFVEITCGLFMPLIQKGSFFRGKNLHWEFVHSKKLSSPKKDNRIVYVFIFRKVSNDYDENGQNDDDFIHNNDDDFLMQLCDDGIDKDLI